MAKAIKDPNTAAYQASTQSPKQSGQACPYTYDHIFIYPLRYALVEETNDSHPAFQPGIDTKIKPMGLRLARKGYFYYIHSDKPDRLRLKIITSKGAFAGESPIKLPKQGMLWFYFSEIKWTEKKETMIVTNELGMRDKLMQKVFLSGFSACDGSDHLMPWSEGSVRIAECKPLILSDPLAKQTSTDTQQQSKQTKNDSLFKFETSGFYWSLNKIKSPGGHHLSLFDKTPTDQSAFILMFDVLAVLRDLTNYQGYLAEWEEKWRTEEQHKFFTADFIEGLYTYKFDEAKQSIEEQTEQKIQVTEKQYELLKQRRELERERSNLRDLLKGSGYSYQQIEWTPATKEKQDRLATINQEITAIDSTLEGQLGKHYETANDAFDQYADAKDSMKSDMGGWAPRVKNQTRFKEMTAYLKQYRAWLRRHDQLRDLVVKDRTKVIPRFYQAAWFFDSLDQDQHKYYSNALFASINYICDTHAGTAFAHDYFIQQAGIQNMLELMPSDDTDWQGIVASTRKALSVPDKIKSYVNALEDANKLSDLLLSADVDQQLVDRMKQSSPATHMIRNALEPAYLLEVEQTFKAELTSLREVGKTGGITGTNPFITLMEKAGPGMRSLFIEGILSTEGGGMKLASEADINQFDQLMRQLNQTQSTLKQFTQTSRQLKQRCKTATNQSMRQQAIREYKHIRGEISKIRQQQMTLLDDIADMTDPLNSAGRGVIAVSVTHSELPALRTHYNNLKQALLKTYYAAKSKAAALKVAKPGYLSLAVLIANVVNFVKVQSEVNAKSKMSGTDLKLYVSALAGAAGAVNTVISEMKRNRIKASLEQNPSRLLADRLAKVTVLTGGAGALLNFLSSFSTMLHDMESLETAIKEGNTGAKVGLGVKQVGNVINLYASTRQTHIYVDIVNSVIFKRTETWRGALASRTTVLARFNVWLLAAIVLVVIGTVIYEYFNPTKLIKWVKESPWGKDNRGYDEQTSHQLLAEAITVPTLQVKAGKRSKQLGTAGYGIKQTAKTIKYVLSIMGFSPARLFSLKPNEPSPIALSVAVQLSSAVATTSTYQQIAKSAKDVWLDITDDVLLTSDYTLLEQGLVLEFTLPEYLTTAQGSVEWILSVIPDLAHKPLNSTEGYIRYSSDNIQQVGNLKALKFSDVLLRVDQQPLKALRFEHIDTTGNTP
ncbi:toxin VasX [Zooshikella sp. RANM57]|uniref:toxin VasX n=1 Tax=Zooshikella sp. RANM57 TaxID=3425863 RepID=UPI003D6EA67F